MFSRCHLLPLLRRAVLIREFLVSLLFLTLLLPAQAAAPSWWAPRGVIVSGKTSDDFAAINQGQLKYLVSAAVAEMNAKLTDGAGTSLNALVNAWTTNPAGADDYAVVTVGQLKTVAKPVYERLLAAGAISGLPTWATANGSDDYAVANIGQAKSLFAFEVPDQVSMLVMQALHVQQSMAIEQTSPNGLIVWLERNGTPVPNETVTFEIFQSLGGLVAVNDTNATPQPTFSLVSDANGYASCQFRAPAESAYSWVRATATGAAPQWFLMTVAGGSGSFPSNPPGITGVDFVQDPSLVDSDEDGVPDDEDIVPYDPSFKEERSTGAGTGSRKYAVIDMGVGWLDGAYNSAMGSSGTMVWKGETSGTWHAWSPITGQTVDFTVAIIESLSGLSELRIADIRGDGRLCGIGKSIVNIEGVNRTVERVFVYDPFTGSCQVFPISSKFYNYSGINIYQNVVWGVAGNPTATVQYEQNNITYRQLILLTATGETVLRAVQVMDTPEQLYPPEGSILPITMQAGVQTERDVAASVVSNISSLVWNDIVIQSHVEDHYFNGEDGAGYTRTNQYYTRQKTTQLVTSGGQSLILATRDYLSEEYFKISSVSTHTPLPWIAASGMQAKPLGQYENPDHLWIPAQTGYEAHRLYGSEEQYELQRPLDVIFTVNGEGMALVQGYMSDGTFDQGIWANGEAISLPEMIGQEVMDQYDSLSWGFRGLSDQGTIAASVRRLSDNTKRMLLLAPIEALELQADGSVKPASNTEFSNPSPTLDVTTCEVEFKSAGFNGDGEYKLLVDIELAGTIDDQLADITPEGPGGSVRYLWIEVNEQQHEMPVPTPSKLNRPEVSLKRYDYTGSFDTTLQDIPVVEGVNTLKIVAMNDAGREGYALYTFTVENDGEGTEVIPLSLAFSAEPSDTVEDSVTVSSLEYGFSRVFLEDGVDSTTYLNTDPAGKVWTLEITQGTPSDDSTLVITLDREGALLPDSATYSLLQNSGSPLAYEAAPWHLPAPLDYSAGDVEFVEKSEAGPFHPVMIVIRGLTGANSDTGSGSPFAALQLESEFPEAVDLDPATGYEEDMPPYTEERKWVKWEDAPVGAPPDAVYMSGKDEQKPGLFVLFKFRNTVVSFDYGGLQEELGQASSFEEGFGKGFVSGGVEMVGDGVSLIGSVTSKVSQYWKLITRGPSGSVVEQAKIDAGAVLDVGKSALKIAKAVSDFKHQRQVDAADAVIAWVTGDDAKLDELGGRYSDAFGLAAEVFDYAIEEVSDLSEGEQGLFMGRLTFEIASVFFSFTKASKVNKLGDIAKADFLEELAKGEVFTKGRGPAVLSRVTQYIAKLKTTKMCFVAGTLVWCQVDGAALQMPIERLEEIHASSSELKVWAKDEVTGEEGWKHPVAFFETRPVELHHLSIDQDGDGQADETFSGTAPHPFWVQEQNQFVPMADLLPGDTLYLAHGGSATVTENARERAPPGQAFTTYNFEVADFHTYFVGQSGVWVHNAGLTGRAPCEKAFSIFHRYRDRDNGKIWDPFKNTMAKLSARVDSPEILNQKVFNEARKKYFDEGLIEPGPWLNKSGLAQTLTNPPSSTNLAKNLEAVLGYKKIPNSAAHHIVPKGQAQAEGLRTLLDRYGIHLDDASNGTFMVSKQTRSQFGDNSDWLDGLGPNHQNHPGASPYISRLQQDLAEFNDLDPTPANVDALKNELQKIAKKLTDNDYPWP